MGAYNLAPDEAVIMQDSNVSRGSSSVKLILTNQHLIQVNKGFFGGDTDSVKYPLLDLKVLNGKPNIRIGKEQRGGARLELYFTSKELYYSFKGVLTEHKWKSAIEKAYKICAANEKKNVNQASDSKSIIAPLKGTIEAAKNIVAKTDKTPIIRTVKCPRCGAGINGNKGDYVKCEYCNTLVRIR